MIWHSATPEEVLEELGSDRENGLPTSQIAKRLKQYGTNLSVLEKDISISKAILTQVKRPSIIILLSLLVIFVLRELVTGNMDFTLPIVCLFLILVKAACCVFLEYRSRNMMASLINRVKTSARVVRGGREEVVPSEGIVPGDILKLTEGDYIPADARLIESIGLRCDEAALYNEKETVVIPKIAEDIHEDHTPLSERTNMIYCGCHILTGDALAVVTETGEEAEIRRAVVKDKVFSNKGIQDKIANRYSDFFKIFNAFAVFGCFLILFFGTLATDGTIGWGKFLEALIAAVCFFIAVVPGSFATRIASLLALGIKRFEKDRASIFNAQTIEKLSGVTVICADKTGILTQNKMSLKKVYDGEQIIDLDYDSITKNGEIALRFAALCCDDNEELTDHTEEALITASSRYLNIYKSDFDAEFPRLACIPLTPERKIKTTVNMIDGRVFVIVRGAPDIILEKCVGADNNKITEAYEQLCNEGMRVLAISYKTLDAMPTNPNEEILENELQFLGLLGLSDRERRGINKDISLCKKAGISTVMFTGDHINTAASIAQKMDILGADDLCVTGEQIASLSDAELTAVAPKIKVCVRFSADDRIRMVKALQANNETVLITADSAANFAPMAYADVGCAMGKSGTDVAKGNADVCVYDDSFSTIIKAIRNARGIFGNFIKYINYYVAMCTCLLIVLLFNMLVFRAIVPSQSVILLGAVFALLFPIASIGFETADSGIMKQTPRTVGEKLFGLRDTIISVVKGIAVSVPPILSYLLNCDDPSVATTVFLSLVTSLVYFMLTDRSTDFAFKRIAHNRFLFSFSIICIVLAGIIATTDLSYLFDMATVSAEGLVTSILSPLLILIVFEAVKIYKNVFRKNNKNS
ncbi:MAG: cation-transporting P-type ATPase [Ruminococcaceae bacterium]|nr:cation-transporting P-type ATPase [Oscillospiraceae bacterium]